ncbi:hypothetical protein [Tenacibaculum xiamenense]|uniref:hypothetical protein n=1 Tax=Tenacibaculum xiamenense TaxID=1261553 RepID=UPI0038B47F0E
MRQKQTKTHNDNIDYLSSFIGLTIDSAFQEQYFFEGKLNEESMGTLKLIFSNGQKFTFDCDGNAESLIIRKDGFTDKGILESNIEDNRYKWKEVEFISSNALSNFGNVINVYLEEFTNEFETIQSGCKIEFKSGDYLRIWTKESDNIFYGLNKKPPYLKNENLKIELKTLYNH